MKKTILIIVLSVALSACADGLPRKKPFTSTLCGNVAGYTVSFFVYGEGKMAVVPLSKVRRETVFIIGLRPVDGYEDADVTVEQESGTPDWIGPVTNNYQDLPKKGFFKKAAWLEVGCAPDVDEGTSYKYKIVVKKDEVENTLDPRADVVW